MMLDRGQSQDWFGSAEIIVEAVAAGLAFYLFLVHMFTAEQPFIEPGLFSDRNFAAGLALIFVVGIILLATLALLPPFLQNLMGYPVITTGFVLAPRGIGTMVAMMLVGRLIGKVNTRWLILLGHRADRGFAVGNGGIHRRGTGLDRRPLRHRPGARSRLHLRAPDHGDFRHPARAPARRRHRHVQPDA